MRKSAFYRLLVFSWIFTLVFLSGCGGGGTGNQGPTGNNPAHSGKTPPSVIASSPDNGAAGLPVTAGISASFSKTIDPATVTPSTFILTGQGKNPVAGDVACTGDKAAFTPKNSLAYSTTYTATLTTGIKDTEGNNLTSNFSWSFTTGAMPDTTPPTVISTGPSNGSTGVATGSYVTVTFSEPMDPASINSTSFTLNDQAGNPVACTVAYSGAVATSTPKAPLAYGTVYTASVTTGAKDLAGNTLAAIYAFSFTTVPPPDTVRPTVLSTRPPDGGANISVSTAISALFSEPMDQASINTATFTMKDAAGNPVAGIVSYSGTTGTFTPSTPLAYSSTYTASVNTGARDLAGNPLASAVAWSFKTTAPPAITGGRIHTVGLKGDGTVWAWGWNGPGQLGDGTTVDRSTPVQSKISGVSAVAAGEYHTVALKPDGTVWAWGSNSFGQLGDGTTNDRPLPAQVSGITAAVSIAGGLGTHTSALKSDGTVWSWGNNGFGQLGNGTTMSSSTPVQATGLANIQAVTEGWSHTLALKNDGTLWAWGRNTEGQLGNNSTLDSSAPLQVSGLAGVTIIASGGRHNIALKGDGTVWAWGWNASGQLGDGTTVDKHLPAQINGLTGVVAIAAGYSHSVALKSDGTVWAWGDNNFQQLGTGVAGNFSATPVRVNGLSRIIAIASGWSHIMALRNDGTLWTLGYNYYGQLGNGTLITSAAPVQVMGF